MNHARALVNMLRFGTFRCDGLLSPRQRCALDPFMMIRDREQVDAMRPVLAALGRMTGQPGALDAIDVLIRAPSALRKTPCLVVVSSRPDLPIERLAPHHLKGAVLIYEYRFAGAPTRIFATDDIFGERTVLAAPEIRAEVAEEACRFLVERGAMACLVSVGVPPGDSFRTRYRPATTLCEIGHRVRLKERDLTLAGSFEATLATIGRSTRHNLKRYRARVEEQFGARYIPEALLSSDEIVELSRHSTNPVPADLALWRHQLARAQPDAILAGLQAADGRWLSLVGGGRQYDRAVLRWQTNRAAIAHHSICSAMRSFLIQDEIARGTRTISFLGGTHHSLAFSLEWAPTIDVVAVRRGLRGEALRWLAHRIFPESNFLGHALSDPAMDWSGSPQIAA